MFSQITSRALLCAAACIFYATTQAQSWPQRWNTSSTYDDEAVASATDHFGNVLTVGWSKQFNSPYKDLVVIKYDAAGNRLWVQNYHSSNSGTPYSGDTVGTAIAVDWLGNVYASGVAYSGSTRLRDFVVIKYDPTGTPVWPSSGSGSGYDFDNGALRLSDNNDDGFDHNEITRCAIAIQDVGGFQPWVAFTRPSNEDDDGNNYADKDYLLIVYDKSNATRFSAVTMTTMAP